MKHPLPVSAILKVQKQPKGTKQHAIEYGGENSVYVFVMEKKEEIIKELKMQCVNRVVRKQ